MPNEKSTGENPMSGVEAAAAAGKTTAQSVPGTRVAVEVRARSLDAQSTEAAKDFATHMAKEDNRTLRSESQDFMRGLKAMFSGRRRKDQANPEKN